MGERTIVFVDEIHRFNKAQQDAFLPFVEKGSIILIGATTENPSFEINSALALPVQGVCAAGPSRTEELVNAARAGRCTDPRGFGGQQVEHARGHAGDAIANFANGDARTALNTLEMVVLNGDICTAEARVVHQGNAGAVHLAKNPCSMTRTARSTTT